MALRRYLPHRAWHSVEGNALIKPKHFYFCSKYTQMCLFPSQMFPVSMFQLGLGFLLIMAIINTQLWSRVAWCVQLGRLFGVCFFISIIWNWFYMYKVKSKLWFFFCCYCSIRADKVATYLLFLSDCFCWSPKKHGEAGRNQWQMHWTEEIWLVRQFERWDVDICLTGISLLTLSCFKLNAGRF